MECSLGRRQLLLASLAAPLLPAPARAADARLAAVAAGVILPLMAAHAIPGLALGITVEGRHHLFHHGVASRESGSPVTAETLFEIGSLSKTFTATLATWADARGQLSLAESPARYVPALRGSALEAATLLQLGTYAGGGLPLQFPDDVRDVAGAIAFYRAWRPEARPGQVRRYSNPSIGLLGHAAALALGRGFSELAEEELFPQLGLRHTFLGVPASREAAYAWGYDKADRPVRVNPGVFDAQGYGVKTTAADLLRFLDANIDGAALPPTLRRAVAATHVGRFRVGPMVQGLGWEQYPYPVPLDRLQAGNASTLALDAHPVQPLPPAPAATLFNKTGSTNGFGAYAAFVPARRIGIVLLANRNIPNAARVEAVHTVLQQLAAG